jgi:hypothetical protein
MSLTHVVNGKSINFVVQELKVMLNYKPDTKSSFMIGDKLKQAVNDLGIKHFLLKNQ